MPASDDIALLQSFVKEHSEAAFTTLVSRHIGLVYSAALRQTGSAPMAEEVTQAVFIILARKAGSLGKGVVLSGWLYQTARLTAANHLRAEIRRTRREQEAYMNALENDNETAVDAAAWQQIAPTLETAMGSLSQSDRDAIVLRYFENKDMSAVAAELNVSEVATRKRLNRAIERLRKFFSKRGITLSAAALGTAVSAGSVHAAPASLALAVSATAIKGSTTAASTTTLVKLTMKTMNWIKLKFAIRVGSIVLLGGGAATVAISQTSSTTSDIITAQDIVKQSQSTYAALSSYSDTGTVLTEVSGTSINTTFTTKLQRPNQYRIDWTQSKGGYTSKGIVWSAGTGNYLVMGTEKGIETAKPQAIDTMEGALASATGISGGVTANVPGTFFNLNWGGQFKALASPTSKVRRLDDEPVGDTDCNVLENSAAPRKLPNNSGSTGTTTTRLWIGKRDHLLHQIQTSMDGNSISFNLTDTEIKTALEKQGKPATPEDISRVRKTMETSMKAVHGKIVFTQTHENIVINASYPATDFARSP